MMSILPCVSLPCWSQQLGAGCVDDSITSWSSNRNGKYLLTNISGVSFHRDDIEDTFTVFDDAHLQRLHEWATKLYNESRSKTQVPGSLVWILFLMTSSSTSEQMRLRTFCRHKWNLQDTDTEWWRTKGYSCCSTAFQGQHICGTAIILPRRWQGLTPSQLLPTFYVVRIFLTLRPCLSQIIIQDVREPFILADDLGT